MSREYFFDISNLAMWNRCRCLSSVSDKATTTNYKVSRFSNNHGLLPLSETHRYMHDKYLSTCTTGTYLLFVASE